MENKLESRRAYLTLQEILGDKLPEHITVNPELTKRTGAQYEIIRSCRHDGTAVFELELIAKTLEPILTKTSYFVGQPLENVVDVKYEVGVMSLATVYGTVDLPAGRFPGERQRTRLPVKCTLIYESPELLK
jgi:hypothetical protein